MANAPRVAMTLTQDWQRVPGGTAVAANALAAALAVSGRVLLTGVGAAGRLPDTRWRPTVETTSMRLSLPWLYEAWDRLRRPRVTSAVPDADLVHLTVPIACPRERVPVVATVHDVLPLTMPEMFTARGARLMRRGLERIREEATMVMVPSEMGAEEFRRQGFDPSRLAVVPLGVTTPPEPDDAQVAAAMARHELAAPYVLFVGTAEPRKGLDVLAEALSAMDRPELTLAMAGPTGWGNEGEGGSLAALIDRLGTQVRPLGFVDGADLDLLRAGAAVCCLPSRAEGFGLPVLEAMAAGAPVVTTKGTPMEEFADGVASIVPPGDPEALASALTHVVDDRELADSMATSGRARAAEYSWDRSASAVLDVYDQVLRR